MNGPRLLLAAFICALPASAATISSTWSGGATGDWSTPGNWTPNGVPNNNGTDVFNVNIPPPSAVNVNGQFAIEIFDLDAGASAILPAGLLTLNANSILDGLLRMGVDGNFATGRLALAAGVTLSGAGTIELLGSSSIEGGPAAIGSGITIQTGAGGPGAVIDSDLTAAGPVDINNAGFTVNFGRTFTVSGPLDLAADARLHAIGATVVLQNNTTQLNAGSEINGGVTLNGATVNGSGSVRPQTFNLFGTNAFNTTIDPDQTTVIANGAAVLNGSGSLIGDGTPLNAAAPGATLTVGPNFNLGGSLTINLPTRLQGPTNTSGVFTLASDLDNDGTIEVNGASIFRVNANANVVAGSTGTINIGPNASLEVTGPATLGGSYSVSGDFIFKGGVTTVVGDWNGDGNSEIVLQSGTTTANFSQEVANAGHLTVPSNGNLSFNGGLLSFSSATLTGSTAALAVTGDTTATGLFQLRNGATHRGPGTTTAQGALEFDGKLDGRTLVAKGPTQGEELTLQNNALFVNEGTYSFFSFGPPAAVTGNGIFRNEGTLTQVTNGFSDFIPTNTISVPFEQTEDGILAPVSTIELKANSTVAGGVTIPEDATLTFSAGVADTTHTVPGATSGAGKMEAKGNAATGARTRVELTGAGDLSGTDSGTTIRSGATINVSDFQFDLGNLVELIDDGTFPAAPPELDLVILTQGVFNLQDVKLDGGKLSAPAPAPGAERQVVTAESVTATGNNVINNVKIQCRTWVAPHVFETKGVTAANNSIIAIGPSAEASLHPGNEITSTPPHDPAVSLFLIDGGTVIVEGFADPEERAPPVEIDVPVEVRGGSIVIEPGAGMVLLNGFVSNSLSGPFTLSVLGFAPEELRPGTDDSGLHIEKALELRDTTISVNPGGNAEITLGVEANRDDVERFIVDLDEPNRLLLANILNPDATVSLDGTGSVNVRELLETSANVSIGAGKSPGRLNATGNLTLGAGSDITVELGGTAQMTQYDLFAVTGVLDVSAASLRPVVLGGFQNSITSTATFTVIEATEPIVGNFVNVFNGRVSTADNTGSFSIAFTENRTRVVLGDFIPAIAPEIDSDSDGMSDAFETQFGLNPNDPADAAADADSDGEDNLAEFRSETDPTNPNSITRSGRTLNISTRLRVLTGENRLIGGYIITGSDPMKVIVRSLGPSLAAAGVPDTLPNPTLELFDSSGTSIAFNNDWKDTQQAEIEATTIPPTDDLEAAIVQTLDPGAYTAVVSGLDDGTGVSLVEVYDLTGPPAKLANISTRGFVDAGDNVMIGGFILGGGNGVNGSGSAQFIARAVGPSLANAGVPDALQDPTLEVYNGNGDLIGANDNWKSDQQAEIEATTIPPSHELEAAVVATVPAGAYTAIVRGVNDGTGVGLIEVYNLNP